MGKNKDLAAIGSVINALRKERLAEEDIMALVANRTLVGNAPVKKEPLGHFPGSCQVTIAPDGTVCTLDTSLTPHRLTIGEEVIQGEEIESLAGSPVPVFRLVNSSGQDTEERLVAAFSIGTELAGPFERIARASASVPHLFLGTSVAGHHILYVKEGMDTIVEPLVADHIHGIFNGGSLVCYEKAGEILLGYVNNHGRLTGNWKCKERVSDAAMADKLVVKLDGELYRVTNGCKVIDRHSSELTKLETKGVVTGSLISWENLVACVTTEGMYAISEEECAFQGWVEDATGFPWFRRGHVVCVMTGYGTDSANLAFDRVDVAFHSDPESDTMFASWASHRGNELAWGKRLKRRIVIKSGEIDTSPSRWCILKHRKMSKLIYVQQDDSGRWRVTDGVVNYGETWTSVLRIIKTKNGKGIIYWAFDGQKLFKVTATVFA